MYNFNLRGGQVNHRKDMYLNFPDSKIVAFYKYRTARVFGFSISDIDIESIYDIQEVLEANGYTMDNHICWTTEDGFSYMWSDRGLTIGTKLVVENW